jgi:iron-sulfur cluster assembly protein
MLEVTETAAAAIRNMLDDTELPPNAGLRISAELDEQEQTGLHLALESAPHDEDEILNAHGVNVFLDASAAAALEHKILDAELHGDHAHFSLDDR